MTATPIPIMLLVSSLEHGGAERQVVELANHLDRARFDPTLCSLSELVPLAEHLRERERVLRIVPKQSRFDRGVIGKVAGMMKERGTRLVHNFLFDAEMVGRLAARRAGVAAVVASERNTDYRRPWSHWLGQHLTRGLFDLMVANSESGKRFNIRTLGLKPERIHVVRNGVDTDRFHPLDKRTVRAALGLPHEVPIVGMVASFKRQKNHADYFRLARGVLARFPAAQFLCVGEPLRDNLQGAQDYHFEMHALLDELRLGEHFVFLGARQDMPEIYNACDLTVLTSAREGTPNVLLESLACGVPVVATDVSDNAQVVPQGQVGFVVALHDVSALTDRVCELLGDSGRRAALGVAARDWAQTEFSIPKMVERMQGVYEGVLRSKGLIA
ncbi:MAG: glycosyltransferase [Phycisphaerae bacterium]